MYPLIFREKALTIKERDRLSFSQVSKRFDVDESGFAHDMPRTHGYSTKGERCCEIKDWHAKGTGNSKRKAEKAAAKKALKKMRKE